MCNFPTGQTGNSSVAGRQPLPPPNPQITAGTQTCLNCEWKAFFSKKALSLEIPRPTCHHNTPLSPRLPDCGPLFTAPSLLCGLGSDTS